MTCKLRKMKITDIDAAIQVSKEAMIDAYNRFEKGYYPKKAIEFDLSQHNRENYLNALKNDAIYVFVAEINGKVVGVARGMIIGKSGYSILHWIGVHPTTQRQGIGKKLLGKVVDYCKKQGCHKISLNTLPALIPAMNLYLKRGFVPEAYLRKQWWKVDFLQMSKWLD